MSKRLSFADRFEMIEMAVHAALETWSKAVHARDAIDEAAIWRRAALDFSRVADEGEYFPLAVTRDLYFLASIAAVRYAMVLQEMEEQ